MRQTRLRILESIRKRGSATIPQLAADAAVAPVTVRHHLYGLMAEGLVQRTLLRSGVGRPQHGYSLTESGRLRFPTGYRTLSARLLSTLKQMKPEAELYDLLEAVVRHLYDAPDSVRGLSPQERLHNLQFRLQRHGISVRIQAGTGDHARLEIDCPYTHVSQAHPELCRVGEKVLQDMLQMPLERRECLLHGDKSCTFNIRLVETSAVRQALKSGSE